MNDMKLTERQKTNIAIILGISLNCNIRNINIVKSKHNNDNVSIMFTRSLNYKELCAFNSYFDIKLNKSILRYVIECNNFNITIKLIMPNERQISIFDDEHEILKSNYENKIISRFNNYDFAEHFMETIFPVDTNEKSYVFYFTSHNNYIGYANILSESKCLKSYDGTIPSEALIFTGTPNDAYLASKKRTYNSSLNIDWKFLEVSNSIN